MSFYAMWTAVRRAWPYVGLVQLLEGKPMGVNRLCAVQRKGRGVVVNNNENTSWPGAEMRDVMGIGQSDLLESLGKNGASRLMQRSTNKR